MAEFLTRSSDFILNMFYTGSGGRVYYKPKCPLVSKITKEIYSDENKKLSFYKKYKEENFKQLVTVGRFYKFMKSYYNCLCIGDKVDIGRNTSIYVYIDYDIDKYDEIVEGLYPDKIEDPEDIHILDYLSDKTKKNLLYFPKGLIDQIKNCKEKYVMLFLSIEMKRFERTRHANSLIFDTVNKSIILFEPHGAGYDDDYNDNLSNILFDIQEKIGYKHMYTPASSCLRLEDVGVQTYESDQLFDNLDGFCLMFSLLFICYRLDYPKTHESILENMMFQGQDKLLKKINKTESEKNKNVSKEIRLFTNLFVKHTEILK